MFSACSNSTRACKQLGLGSGQLEGVQADCPDIWSHSPGPGPLPCPAGAVLLDQGLVGLPQGEG